MKRYQVRGMRRTIEQLMPLAKPGTVTHVQVEHDDACPAWRTQRAIDCICDPRVALKRPVDVPKKERR